MTHAHYTRTYAQSVNIITRQIGHLAVASRRMADAFGVFATAALLVNEYGSMSERARTRHIVRGIINK